MYADLKYYALQACQTVWAKVGVGVIGGAILPVQDILIAGSVVYLIDFFLGVCLAIKMSRFSSAGLRRGFVKLGLYVLLIIAVGIPENEFFGTTYATKTVTGLIVLTELISILENMTLLGLPVPFSRQLMRLVADKARLYGLAPSTANFEKSPVLLDLMDLVRERIPTLAHSELRQMMDIYVKVWLNFAASVRVERMTGSPELMFEYLNQQLDHTVIRAIQLFREQGVPEKHVKVFLEAWNAELLARLKAQIAQTCGAVKFRPEDRLLALCDFVALMLYRLMAAVRRFDSDNGDIFDSRADHRISPATLESPSGLHQTPRVPSSANLTTTERVLQFRTPAHGVTLSDEESSQITSAAPSHTHHKRPQ